MQVDTTGRKTDRAIGEVISASITEFITESWPAKDSPGNANRPDFGSFLKVEQTDAGLEIVGIVYDVFTGPADRSHKTSALGLTRAELKAEQPQIFSLLTTEISAITVGFVKEGRIYRHLPPQPPMVHDFVRPATGQEIREFTSEFDYLNLAARVQSVPADELLAAVIRNAYESREHDYNFLLEAGQFLAGLLKDDYDRLEAVLRKIKPV